MGKSTSEAAGALEGYTIVTDDFGNKVDFNSNAGGGWGSKGDKVVYIGYKTTTERKDAITDIALMNMKGSYSIDDYDTLMDDYMREQIIPLVDGFIAAIEEYRENYHSSFPANKARADYVCGRPHGLQGGCPGLRRRDRGWPGPYKKQYR